MFSLQVVLEVGAMEQCSYKPGQGDGQASWFSGAVIARYPSFCYALLTDLLYSIGMSSGEIATSLLSILVLSGLSVPAQGLTVD